MCTLPTSKEIAEPDDGKPTDNKNSRTRSVPKGIAQECDGIEFLVHIESVGSNLIYEFGNGGHVFQIPDVVET